MTEAELKTAQYAHKMKDWIFAKGRDTMYLKHNCIVGGCYFASKNKEGRWYCEECHIYAPEEIDFVADLANCEPLYRGRFFK